MGGKRRDKENEQDKKGKDKAATAAKARQGQATAGPFQLPAPDRTCHVASPGLRPPPVGSDGGGDGCGEDAAASAEVYSDAAPRKLQLDHMTFLKHPVFIGGIDNFLTEDECHNWIEWGEKQGFEEAKQRQTAEFAHRENGRLQVTDPEIAQLLWLRIRPFVPDSIPNGGAARRALGCSPRIRLYRYTRGQRFGQHIDQSFDEPTLGGRTHFTVLVYLNGGTRDPEDHRMRGGETVFWKDRDGNPTAVALAFPPTRGVCLYHGHGDECMIHESSPIEAGTKYVLRTDVVYENE